MPKRKTATTTAATLGPGDGTVEVDASNTPADVIARVERERKREEAQIAANQKIIDKAHK